MRLNRSAAATAILAGAAIVCLAPPAVLAQTNLVTNGTFNQTGTAPSYGTLTASEEFGTYPGSQSSYTPPQMLAGWTSPNGYNFVYLSAANATSLTGSATAAYSATGTYGTFALYGPSAAGGNTANGFQYGAPDGKGGYTNNYLALDSDYAGPAGQGVAVTQTIGGLKAQQSYVVSFVWAAAQQYAYTGSTTDQLQVTFGSTTKDTQTVSLPQGGFSGWMTASFSFIASSTSQTLSFLATGSPAVPPFILLSDVSVVVPEPASIPILMTGLTGVIFLARRRRQAALAGGATSHSARVALPSPSPCGPSA